MSKRRDWEFQYPAATVADHAEEKAQYHSERKQWWEDEREKVVAKIKESGLEVREYEITGGKDAQVVVDPELARRLSECQNKISSHKEKTKEYDNWATVLHSSPDKTLALNHDDVLYFGL